MSKEENSNCIICLEKISPDSGVIDCGHAFCVKCIKHWCEQCSTCPLCRKEITQIKLFYRSFYFGQTLYIEHKKQKVHDIDESLFDPGFIVSDSADILISSQENDKNHIDNDKGTGWIDGSRHSLREPHHSNQQYEQSLIKLKIQRKNEK